MIEALREILSCTRRLSGENFSGTGVIVAECWGTLPILPLRAESIPTQLGSTAEILATISHPNSIYHDGFHILDSSLKIKLMAQYFSPSIITGINLNRSKLFGGRYVAALLGSCLNGVAATGIASRDYGISIFVDGSELFHEANL